MKIMALDIGDKWVGVALSDPIGFFAQPHTTVELPLLPNFLKEISTQEEIETIVVGYPKTLRGTESEQTKKIVAYYNKLKEEFPDRSFVLWDERLTSAQAAKLKKTTTKEEKLKSHAIAAAFILTTYLEYLRMQKMLASEEESF